MTNDPLKKMDAELSMEFEKLKATINALPDTMLEIDQYGVIHDLHIPCNTSLRMPEADFKGKSVSDMFPEDAAAVIAEVLKKASVSGCHRGDIIIMPASDGYGWFEISAAVKVNGMTDRHFIVLLHDITRLKNAEYSSKKFENKLHQNQKIEAIGRLASGIAHDFNNMLAVIIGYAQLMKPGFSENDPRLEDIIEIEKAASVSREIIGKLLAFSRKQAITPQILDLNKIIGNTTKSIIRLIGENIAIEFNLQEDLWEICFDPSQIDQILINLAVNSRDAMPFGGKITVGTSNITADEYLCIENPGLVPGRYILLEVGDNGSGMDNETLFHIFEPFFTTKESGKGTGLGLSTVYGIVKQNNGFIFVSSEPEKGTAFRIYIPEADPSPLSEKDHQDISCDLPGYSGTVLLVEDDDLMRKMAAAMLVRLGYTVLEAADIKTAESFCEKRSGKINLVVTDIIMPGTDGISLGKKIKSLVPEIREIFMTGYFPEDISRYKLPENAVFLQKPFTIEHLALKIREAMA